MGRRTGHGPIEREREREKRLVLVRGWTMERERERGCVREKVWVVDDGGSRGERMDD